MAKRSGFTFNARRCIFCGGEPLTREHLLPVWMHPLLRQGDDINGHHGIFADTGMRSRQSRPIETHHKKYAGPPWTRTFKVVCAACNGGWMSGLETAAKPALGALIEGRPGVTISAVDQHNITKWLALKLMVLTQGQPVEELEISADVRDLFYRERGKLPDNWQAFLGRCTENADIQVAQCLQLQELQGTRYETHAFILTLGKAFFYLRGSFGAPDGGPHYSYVLPNMHQLEQISPLAKALVRFDDLKEMNRHDREFMIMFGINQIARKVSGSEIRSLYDYPPPPNIGRLR